MRPGLESRVRRGGVLLGLGAAVLALTGCGPSGSGTPVVRSDELVDAGGLPCPRQLPAGDDPSGHGFGTSEVADELPSLLAPDEAWVCRYDAFDAGTTPSGGTVYGWRRVGQPESVTDLPDVRSLLTLADRSGGCNGDLGSRWMLAYSHDGDLTGIVVDDYGCRDVRLTDNPHTTPPGADGQQGTVGGILDGGAEILDALGVGRLS